MGFYEDLRLKTIINASDTYTRIGGSRMGKNVIEAMNAAAESFVNLRQLGEEICRRIAEMTNNEAAFISSGAGACVVLTTAVLITEGDAALGKQLPDTTNIKKNEIVVFDAQTKLTMLPYWHLIELTGARIVRAGSTIESLKAAINEKTAGVFHFSADRIYEDGLPDIGEVIAASHEMGVPIILDAAAQLPPKSNLWRYTKDLGADGVIFSGGKYLMGPQSTGLFLGKGDIAHKCYDYASPNCSIGRPFKVGKEEYAGIYEAVRAFVEADEAETLAAQNKYIDYFENELAALNLNMKRIKGRLGQETPVLLIDLPNGKNGKDCADYLYESFNPAIDIGYYPPGDPSGTESQIFINSINLKEDELPLVANAVKQYLSK